MYKEKNITKVYEGESERNSHIGSNEHTKYFEWKNENSIMCM